jgi:hypothetical protein
MEEVDFKTWCNALLASTKAEVNTSPTYAEARKGPYSREFKKATVKEYASLDKNQVFQKCILPSGKSLRNTKVVLIKLQMLSDSSKACLYGLKQAPYAWNKIISQSLIKLGFRQLISERSGIDCVHFTICG